MDGIIPFAKLNVVSAQVAEILRSMADPYDPTHTYTVGQLVTYEDRLYRALVDITTPEPWTPEHWQAVDLKDEITQLRAELVQKYAKPADGIPSTDMTNAVQESLNKADTAIRHVSQSLTDAQKEQARNNIDAYTKPTGGIPDTDLDDGVNALLDRANRAVLPDGYYGDSGGVMQYSTNFLGKNTPQNASNVVFRPTNSQMSGQDWSRDSISGQTATIEKIKGKTLVFNQQVNAPYVVHMKKDSLRTQVYDLAAPTVNGHKYLLSFKFANCVTISNESLSMKFVGATEQSVGVFPLTNGVQANVITANQSDNKRLYCYLASSYDGTIAVDVSYPMIIDLTQMYGAGNEPTAVEEFKAQFPLDYYAYNAGELISLNATGLKTVGFNQLYSDGHIDVLAGLTYKIEGTYTSLKDSAGNDVTVTNGEFTPIVNDTYTMVGGSCVHLKWSGVRDGETEPHWDSTLSLPIATYFPDGMKSAGTVYDELTKDKAVKRIGKVDLGTLNWKLSSNGYFGVDKPTNAKSITIPLCSKMNGVIPSKIWDDRGTNVYEITINEADIRAIYGTETNATVFKTAMSGVYLYYELAEPVETPISPELNLTYRCDDFGTEMLLPQNTDEPVTAPMDADIIYQIDYEADVRNMNVNMISKESMDNFISAFNASGLGTITQTWDSTNKRYAYTVTAPQPEPAEGGETV